MSEVYQRTVHAPTRPWPEERTQFLREQYALGMRLSSIARLLGLSTDAVTNKAIRIGIHTPEPRSEAQRFWKVRSDQLRWLVEHEGLTAAQAAKRIGASRSAVLSRARRLKLKFSRKPSELLTNDETLYDLVYLKGYDHHRLSAELGISDKAAYRRIERWKSRVYVDWSKPLEQRGEKIERHPIVFPPKMSDCVWAFGDPGEAGFSFCGQPGHSHDRPYCDKHYGRVYQRFSATDADKIMNGRSRVSYQVMHRHDRENINAAKQRWMKS